MSSQSAYAIVAVALTPRQRMALLARLTRDLARGSTPSADEHPLFQAWHYAIPPEYRGTLSPGQLVWVPFGSDLCQGLILGFDSTAPVSTVRPISAVSRAAPYLPPHGVPLAQWISDHYVAPLWDTLLLMLPPGTLKESERQLFRTPRPVRKPLSADARRVLSWLDTQGGESTLSLVSDVLGSRKRAQATLAELFGERLLREQIVTKPPGVRPRQVDFVRLIAAGEALDTRFRTLGRASTRAEVVEALVRHAGAMPVDTLLQASGASLTTLDRMVDDHLLRWEPGRFVQRLWPEEEPALSQAMTAALDWVDAWPASEPLPEFELRRAGIATATLDALVARGVLRVLQQGPDLLRLHVPSYRAEPLIDAWRGTERYRAAVRFLERQPTEMTSSEVRESSGLSGTQLARLAAARIVTIERRQVKRNPLADRHIPATTPPPLTPEQRAVWAELRPALHRQAGEVYLLHGVTGSGKTEIYLRAVAETLALGKQAIVLVPEIALTPQTVARFGGRFGPLIALQHSQLSEGERYDEWQRLRDGEAQIAIGSRSAIFAPVPNPGLIVIDEEHEWTYKQGHLPGYAFPQYHTRQVAERIADLTGATVVLGSATPALESYYHADRGRYRLLEMGERVVSHLTPSNGAGPTVGLSPVQVVDMRQELREGNSSIFSRALGDALAEVLEAQQQAILFLNRRGAHSFVMCRDCGWVQHCERCDVPMSYHHGLSYLLCHQCHSRAVQAHLCPRCLSPRIKQFGIGTQQVEAVTHQLFPEARVLRWDSDSARRRGAHEQMLTRFASGQADILVGTQMIAKGLDLPLVTLVGVMSADTSLHLPDFRSGERTFQLLTQVAGRAGRSHLGGRVILQSYTPDHYAVQSASHHNYHSFYRHELAFRRQHAYPPFAELVKLVYRGTSPRAAEQAAMEYAGTLRERLAQLGLPATEIIGPAPSFFGKLHGRYRWQLLIRGPHARDLVRERPPGIGWEVDVDPASVL